MPPVPNASFSDREVVRDLARRLRPVAPRAATPAPAPYVRLVAPVAAVRPVEAPEPPPRDPTDVGGSLGWSRLLEWCVLELESDAAFLTDERGLVIASAGAITGDDAQGIGARLVIAFQQADRIADAGSRSITIELGNEWLTGVRVPLGVEQLTIGVMAREPLSRSRRQAVERAFADKARDL